MAGTIYYDNGTKWRYENEGTAEGLKVSGTTVTGLNSTKSKTGTAFWQTNRVSTFPIPATKELWVKFDLYYGGAQWRVYDRLNGNDTGFGLIDNTTTLVSYINGPIKLVPKPVDTITKNQLHTFLKAHPTHIQIVFEIWVNGTKYYTDDYADEGLIYKGNIENGADFENFYLQSQNANCLFSNVIISNAPIGLGENVIGYGLTSSLDFDLKTEITTSVELNCDLERNVQKIFRYENYGTADGLKVSGTTVALEKAKSRYYSGFYQTQRLKCFDIPAAKEVWIKFDVYFSVKYQSLFFGSLDNDKTSQARLNCDTGSEYHRMIFAFSNRVASDTSHPLSAETLYRVLLHMKSNSTNGKIEVFFSDGYNLSYTGNVNNGNKFENVYIQAGNYNSISTYPYVSNVIISNSQIGLNENCRVPIVDRFDTLRYVFRTFEHELFLDTLRNVLFSQIIDNDIIRNFKSILHIDNDICRNIIKTVTVNFDTARSIPHNINYVEEENTLGIESIEIQISEQQLTDKVNYTLSNYNASILEQFKGQYLDYEYDLRIEQKTKRGVLTTCFSQNNNDEMLYTQLDYKIPKNEQWHRTDTQNQET